MFPLRCTVRNCRKPLHLRDRGLFCDSGHHFDQAKEGHWNLLQPQDRKSKNPGDADAAVLARHRWLSRGHGIELIGVLREWGREENCAEDDRPPATLDLGCGEGSFGPALFADDADSFCGIDLSKRAIKLACKGWPQATWVLANADRGLPAADRSVGRVISLFGRRPAEEIARVLAASGRCWVAVPGEEDLIELREKVQQSGQRRSRWEMVVDEMKTAGLQLVDRQAWRQTLRLEPDAIADALAMTYRAVRNSQQARMESLEAMDVTLAAELMRFRLA